MEQNAIVSFVRSRSFLACSLMGLLGGYIYYEHREHLFSLWDLHREHLFLLLPYLLVLACPLIYPIALYRR